MVSGQWARLSEDVNCGLRRAAWYSILSADSDSVVLAVHRDEKRFSRDLLELSRNRPAEWTMVIHGRHSVSFLARAGKRYAVCPTCRHRQVPIGRPKTLRCQKCNGLFEIAWDRPFNVGGPSH